MSTIIKSYTSIIFIIIAALTLGGIISAAVDVKNVRDYHAAVITEIEESNHAQSVINACLKETNENEKNKKKGYELSIVNMSTDTDEGNISNVAKVTLKYKYSIGFLNLNSDHEIVGYAR